VRSHIEFGTRVAQQNSHANTDADLHSLRHVPRWTWPGDTDLGWPPRSSDPKNRSARGRRRHA
jgi:hypothetical protein